MDLGIMVEGQEGLSWERWRRLLTCAEDMGYESLWRSDHWFAFFGDPQQESIEPFLSFALAAEVTKRIRFGPLVFPVTFRHPAMLARMAAQIDGLSGGRFVVGMGAGWNEREHEAFGLDFPPVRERFDRLEEAIEVARALWGPGPANYSGRYYQLKDAECYPKPVQQPLPILIGGNGEKRTLRIVAQHADEWNAIYVNVETYRKKNEVLAQHCADVGRDPAEIRRSMMLGYLIGRDEAGIRAHLERIPAGAAGGGNADVALDRLRRRGWSVGTPSQLVDLLGHYEEAGVSRVMLHHHALEAEDVLELVASEVLPQLRR